MRGSHFSSSLQMSSFVCQESEMVGVAEESSIKVNSFDCDFDDECVEMLFSRENQLGFGRNEGLVFSEWIRCARLDSITWILKTREIFGFRIETAYLSMTYFDRFISKRPINIEKSWVIGVLSVACLSLAAKMEEVNVPGLSGLKMEGIELESRVVERMEVLVLSTLEWRMGLVTPFGYIHYFQRKLQCDSVSLSRIVELVVPIMREINLMRYRPSEIALAATLVALEHGLTKSALEFKINRVSCCGFLHIEDVFTCYKLMQKNQTTQVQIQYPVREEGSTSRFS